MSLVLDTCALVDMSVLDEVDTRYVYLTRKIESHACYVTPITAAEIHYRLKKDVSTERADGILAMMRSKQWITVVDDNDLIELASEAMEHGVPPSIAFTAALARRLNTRVVVGDRSFDKLEEDGFCELLRY